MCSTWSTNKRISVKDAKVRQQSFNSNNTRWTASKESELRLSIRSTCNLQITDILVKKKTSISYVDRILSWHARWLTVFYLTDKIRTSLSPRRRRKRQVKHNYQHKCDATHSLTLSLFIDLSPCEKVYCWTCSIMLEEISETKKKKKKDDIRADLFSLTLTRTDFNGMWWSLFFSSFNLCRPVCCRTCHCSSSTAKVFIFETSNLISHRIPFCLRPRPILYVSSLFFFFFGWIILSKQLNAREEEEEKEQKCIDILSVPLYIDLIIPLRISILIKSC